MKMKAIIPTGGRGTRMRPLTFSANKHFIPVANKPLIFYPIETIAKTGIKEIAITYNTGGLEEVQNMLGDGSRWGVSFSYVLQEKPAGLANIVEVCEEFVNGDSFVLHLGDNIFVDGIDQELDYFLREKPNGMVTMLHHPENRRMGVPYFDEQGRLLKYVEKPENPPHDFAIPGLYFADANFFKCFKGDNKIQPSPRGEYEIPTAFQWMIDNGLRVDVVEYRGVWLDPGKFDDWLEANRFLLDQKKTSEIGSELKNGSSTEGVVLIGKDCEISNSRIVGPAIIGDRVVIENSLIDPHASIADGCTIRNSQIGDSVVLSGVHMEGVKRPIKSSLIGKDTEIIGRDESDPVSLFVGELCKVEL